MYIVFYQGGPVNHATHVPGPVAQSSAESEYNAARTAGMALAHFRMLKSELEGNNLMKFLLTLLSLLWRANLMMIWPRMAKTPSIPSTLLADIIL